MKNDRFKNHLLLNGWETIDRNTFTNDITNIFFDSKGNLIHPLPIVKKNYRVVSDDENINKAINSYAFDEVVKAMFNKKITLVL
jgi:hypothetical protein